MKSTMYIFGVIDHSTMSQVVVRIWKEADSILWTENNKSPKRLNAAIESVLSGVNKDFKLIADEDERLEVVSWIAAERI